MSPALVASVDVPATSANLGPGFDCLGLALEWRDTYTAGVDTGAEPTDVIAVSVEGYGCQGSDAVPADSQNLVAASLLTGLEHWHASGSLPGAVALHCINRIPHGRGLGSSSAAIVGGLALARELCQEGNRPSLETLFALAAQMEGHPDNVAPAVFGGFTPTWTDQSGAHAVALTPHPDLVAVVAVPDEQLSTSLARTLLPEQVPLSDAVFNASRASLLSHAITSAPQLLLPGTEDRLHQSRRSAAYPKTSTLVRALRADGLAAVVSGAGPSVLVLAEGGAPAVVEAVRAQCGQGWHVSAVPIAAEGVRATPLTRSR